MGLLANYKPGQTQLLPEQDNAKAVAEFRKMGKTDEQIKKMGYNPPPKPKTGIAKVLEDLKFGKEKLESVPYLGAINKSIPNPSDFVHGAVRGVVKMGGDIAKFLTDPNPKLREERQQQMANAGRGPATPLVPLDKFSRDAGTKIQAGTEKISSTMEGFDRNVGLDPTSTTSKVGEQVGPMLTGTGVGTGASKLISQFPKIASLAKTSPYIARSLQGAAGNASYEATRELASGEELNPTSIGLSAALSPVFEGISKGYGMAAKSKMGQEFMENLTITNLLDRSGIKNILAKVAKGDDLLGGVDETQIDDLASEGSRLLSGKEVKLGDDMVTAVVNKIQQKIKPGTVKEQVTQLDNLATEIKGGVDKSLATIKKAEASPFAKKLLEAVTNFEKKWTPTELSDLSRFKNIKGQWRNNFTPSELNEIKRLSDNTLKMYSKSGDTLGQQSASEVASYRKAVKEQIERMAKEAGITDIAARNAEVSLYKGLAESAKAASYGKRLASLMKSNPLASSIGLATIVGTSYGVSKMMDIPQIVTLPAVAALSLFGTKLGLSNKVTTKMARNIYEKAGKDGVKGFQKYIATGEEQYKRKAEKIIRMIMGEIKALTSKDA